ASALCSSSMPSAMVVRAVISCALSVRRRGSGCEQRAKPRLGSVRERGVHVVGAIGHVDAGIMEVGPQGRDAKESAVRDFGVAREVAGYEERLVPAVVAGERDRRTISGR